MEIKIQNDEKRLLTDVVWSDIKKSITPSKKDITQYRLGKAALEYFHKLKPEIQEIIKEILQILDKWLPRLPA